MNIEKKSILGKLFFWCLGVCEKFAGKELAQKYHLQTNLCHFVRVTFVYAPIIVLIQLLFWISGVTLLIIAPIYYYGLAGYFRTFGLAMLIIMAIVLVGFIFFLLLEGGTKSSRWISDVKKGEKQLPAVLVLASQWVKAKKQKICPIIKFD